MIISTGHIQLQLHHGSLSNKGSFNDYMLRQAFTRPEKNPEIDFRKQRLEFKSGMVGMANETEDVLSNRGQGVLGGLQLAFEVFNSYEQIEISKLERADREKYNNYLTNLNMANYMISESVWLLNSFQVAKTRGAFDDISIDEHGTNFSVDMANYVLLLNTGFLNVEKDKFALNGNLNGLSRTEYMSKLDECYNAIKIDVSKDMNESFLIIDVNKEKRIGGGLVFKALAKATLQVDEPHYKFEPAKPDNTE